MEVVKLKTKIGQERYYLADEYGLPIEPVLKFIKFKDNNKIEKNTLRAYCHHLKVYFEYLKLNDLDFNKIELEEFFLFVTWLQNPYEIRKEKFINKSNFIRSNTTINNIISTVVLFYKYILTIEEYKFSFCGNFSKFLFLTSNNKNDLVTNSLKLKVKKSKINTISKEEIEILIENCNNIRDKFLLNLLYETGFKIGEVLCLSTKNFYVDNKIIDLKSKYNHNKSKVLNSRKVNISSNLVNIYLEYINTYNLNKFGNNNLFIKIRGKNKGEPMDYNDVHNLFKVLKKKTNIYVTSNIIRDSSLVSLIESGWEIESVKIIAGHKNMYTTSSKYINFKK